MNLKYTFDKTFINNKNKRRYIILAYAISATNSNEGEEMVVYFDEKDRSKIFVREQKEFNEKFTIIK